MCHISQNCYGLKSFQCLLLLMSVDDLSNQLLCSAAGAFPFSIGCFAVYANLDKLWQEPPFRFNSLQNFINGCLAAGVAQSLSYPFDTVKRKMQVK